MFYTVVYADQLVCDLALLLPQALVIQYLTIVATIIQK